MRMLRLAAAVVFALAVASTNVAVRAETGYDLWLRYTAVPESSGRAAYRQAAAAIVAPSRSPTGEVIAAELARGLSGLLGSSIVRVDRPSAPGAIVAGTPATSPLVAALGWNQTLA